MLRRSAGATALRPQICGTCKRHGLKIEERAFEMLGGADVMADFTNPKLENNCSQEQAALSEGAWRVRWGTSDFAGGPS